MKEIATRYALRIRRLQWRCFNEFGLFSETLLQNIVCVSCKNLFCIKSILSVTLRLDIT
jgi:hypothetical protein